MAVHDYHLPACFRMTVVRQGIPIGDPLPRAKMSLLTIAAYTFIYIIKTQCRPQAVDVGRQW